MTNILLLEPENYSLEAVKILEGLGQVKQGPLNRSELINNIALFDVVVTRLQHNFDQELLDQAKKLKIIVTNTTGLDHIDCETAQRKSIKIISLKGEIEFLRSITATAELTWGLLLALLRKIPQAVDSVLEGKWQRKPFIGQDLASKTLGIIGYGRIGQILARYGQAFDMKVIFSDPVNKNGSLSLNDLLTIADIISLHVPLNKETENLISEPEFNLMKSTSLLINTSRGKIVDEVALLSALQRGKIAGAALDVLSEERQFSKGLPQSPLLKYVQQHDNLLITPHIGGATIDSMAKTEIFVVKKLEKILKNEN